jgi:hypothetical protein
MKLCIPNFKEKDEELAKTGGNGVASVTETEFGR